MSNNPSHLQFNTTDQKPQYHLIWDAVDEKGFVHRNVHEVYENRDDAVAAYLGLKAAGEANIRGFCDTDKRITVDVVFSTGGKRYTYLHNEPAKPGQLVVVKTSSGLNIVSVVGCNIRTIKELSNKMPFEKYKYLVGLVK